MTTRPRLRRFVLTAHVVSSVGWLGAVAVFVALGIVAMTSQDAQVVRAVYLVMEPASWTVLIPFAIASLLTGLLQSLGTKWGLFRHYWILTKLLVNVVALVVLLLYTQTLSYLAGLAAVSTSSGGDLSGLRNPSPVFHAGLGLLLLLTAAALSVYKPRGMTRYGQRKQHEQRTVSAAVDAV